MRFPLPARRLRQRGFALVLVLAFVVLLTGVCLAFFSNALLQRQVSNSSATRVKVDLLAQGAIDTIITDLKKEIEVGSIIPAATPAPGVKLYTPKESKNMIPEDSGFTRVAGLENLLKLSSNGDFATGVPGRASDLLTNDTTQNRPVPTSRWNKPLYLAPSSDIDLTPVVPIPAPKWVFVSSAPAAANPTDADPAAVGRYAFAIYDEGGLLDVNVAGYPSTLATDPSLANNPEAPSYKAAANYKGATAFADLTRIPGVNAELADAIVGWRHYASAKVSGDLTNYAFSATSLKAFIDSVRSNDSGFLSPLRAVDFSGGKTDNRFASRQQLIDFFNHLSEKGAVSKANVNSALRYLTTFSRDLNQPSFMPISGRPSVLASSKGGNNAAPDIGNSSKLDDKINPSFQTIRVQSSFRRNDDSDATQGEPLVKERFDLSRLAWLTWNGPSALSSAATKSELLKNGVPQAVIDQGTVENIRKYFGLTWRGDPNDNNRSKWFYDSHNGTGGSGPTGSIMQLGNIANLGSAAHEPDFFEMLKATIQVGSLGKAALTPTTKVSSADTPAGYDVNEVPANYRYERDASIDFHIIQLGVNIIDQADPDGLPTSIIFNDGSLASQEFNGVESLPYLSYVVNGIVKMQAPDPAPADFGGAKQHPATVPGTLSNPGVGALIQVPFLWNPHDTNAFMGFPRPTRFRIVTDSADPLTVANGGARKAVYVAARGQDSTDGNRSYLSYAPEVTTKQLQPSNALYNIDYTTAGQPLNASNTALTFTDVDQTNPSGRLLFREPTALLRSGGKIDLQSSAWYSAGLPSAYGNPVYGVAESGTNYLGIVLGKFPLRFGIGGGKIISTGEVVAGQNTANNIVYLTYRVQYEDPANAGTWITFDTKYARTTNGRFPVTWHVSGASIIAPADFHASPPSWAAAIDPRTNRFGMITGSVSANVSNVAPYPPPINGNIPNLGWVANADGTFNSSPPTGEAATLRPDNYSGNYFVNFNRNGAAALGWGPGYSFSDTDQPFKDVPFPSFAAGWTTPVTGGYGGNTVYTFNPGMYSQNSPKAPFYIKIFANAATGGNNEFGKVNGTPQPSYYADPDGVIRRGMAAYVPLGSTGAIRAGGESTIGLPLSSTQNYSGGTPVTTNPAADLNQSQSRPLILNRPYRSVAELGYVFRDVPWKNLDFFTPESGDSALLDAFCVNRSGNLDALVAGKVNLNTKQAPVLEALLSQAYLDDPKVTNPNVGSIGSSVAPAIAAALVQRTTDRSSPVYGPFQNLSELVGKWVSDQGPDSPSYNPPNPNGDLKLADEYKDGSRSYSGFTDSGTISSPAKDISSVLASLSFSGPAMKTSIVQIQRFREAPIRALAGSAQTRTWNLMIDLIAQGGRFPQDADGLDKFAVESEQRMWVHLAIDRLTGKVIDKHIEIVKE